MSKKDFEKYMTGKVTKAMLALSMMSHLSYAQPRDNLPDSEKERNENIKSAQPNKVDIAEKSFNFEQRITNQESTIRTQLILLTVKKLQHK